MTRKNPNHAKTKKVMAAVAFALALAGCDLIGVQGQPPPGGKPAANAKTPPQSEVSRAMAEYYRRVESDLLSQGLLRRDSGGPGEPFGPRELAEDFIRIALYDEYTLSRGRLVARAQASRLRRWEVPITMQLVFGPTIPAEQRRVDTREVTEFAERLSQLTGHPIRVGGPGANFYVLFLNEDERRAFGPRLTALLPGISPTSVDNMVDMPRSTFCLVQAFSRSSGSSAFSKAVVVIRGEHPDLLRQSCIHEELAQGMGLGNDSPVARPSIFNDDEEFGLLTRHDELLLKMLYDPRLKIGMNEAEASPIIRQIAEEYFAGAS